MIFNAAQALRGDDEIVKPRVSASRRQQNRANSDVSSALDYYRVTVYNAFFDSLLLTARGSISTRYKGCNDVVCIVAKIRN